MAANPRYAHTVLMTNRVAEMRDWYCTVLGAHVVYENPMLCFITFDDEHHRMAFASAPQGLPERPPNSTGLMHTAYTFPNLAALLEHYETLKAAGIEPRVPMQHGVTTSMYYLDPDGQFVELQIDNFASADDATSYMHGEEFAANPIGVIYNPQRMLDELRGGADEATLKTRAWALADPQPANPMAVFVVD